MPLPGTRYSHPLHSRNASGTFPSIQEGKGGAPSGRLPGFAFLETWNGRWFLGARLQPLLLLAAMLALLVFLPACAKDPPPGVEFPFTEFPFTQDDRHSIENPSKDRALATGIGCGISLEHALSVAQRIAQFNLRGLTGEARYRIKFRTLKTMPEPARICVEVSAQAYP